MKPFPSPVPVAEYLRMSTEHQQFSLENQSAALRLYAEKNNFSVVKTYVDAGKSGVVLKHRKGLAQLLRDVVEGDQPYRAILVYDVSRWGRFQDTDEAAYYEFLCKRSGFPIHYFAEIFSNDATMSSEYSRELGVKVHAGQERLARLGYRQGAQPGYGLRRLLVSADGSPKQHLGDGERKSIASDRVIQVPGPREEVRCVREIYRMFIKQRMTFTAITKELNRQRIPYVGGTEWNHSGRAVHAILTHPKYAGFNVYGRSSQRLYVPSVKMPKSEWTMVPAFKALIDQATFAAAQRICESFTRNKSDNHLLDVLRTVLAKEGKLTIDLIEGTSGAPAASTYGARFGAVSRAYELIGYDGSWNRGSLENRRNVRVLRNDLIREIVATFPESISIERRGPTFRTRLRLRNGRLISVMASRCFQGYKGIIRWLIKSVPTECQLVTLVARLNTENNAFKDFFVIPPIRTCKGIVVKEDDPRLHRGIPLTDLEHFLGAAQKMSAREVPSFPVYLKNHGNPI